MKKINCWRKSKISTIKYQILALYFRCNFFYFSSLWPNNLIYVMTFWWPLFTTDRFNFEYDLHLNNEQSWNVNSTSNKRLKPHNFSLIPIDFRFSGTKWERKWTKKNVQQNNNNLFFVSLLWFSFLSSLSLCLV